MPVAIENAVGVQTVRTRRDGTSVDPLPEFDVTETMKHVRARAGRRRQKLAPTNAVRSRPNGRTTGDLAVLQSSQDICQVRFSSHRRVVGHLILFAKRVLQQFLITAF